MPYGSVLTDVVQSSTAGTPPQFNDGNGTQIGTLCRAWANFGYVSSAITIRGSFNVSSVTRTGTGAYTVSFTNSMPDANYAAVIYNNADTGTTSGSWNNHYLGGAGSRTTTAITVVSANNAGITDSALFDVVVFR